jgi:nickel-type superoxide dismutase maturation protease
MTRRRPLHTRIAILAMTIEAGAAAAWLGARAARFLGRSWSNRVAVVGASMAPTLLPGDWLLADPDAYRERAPRPGELALLPDPRTTRRLLVKRVTGVDEDGGLLVAGDDPAASTDSRTLGAVDPRTVEGRPWFRYWPLRRLGRVR